MEYMGYKFLQLSYANRSKILTQCSKLSKVTTSHKHPFAQAPLRYPGKKTYKLKYIIGLNNFQS